MENFVIPGRIKANNVPFKSPTVANVENLEKASKEAEDASIEAQNKAVEMRQKVDTVKQSAENQYTPGLAAFMYKTGMTPSTTTAQFNYTDEDVKEYERQAIIAENAAEKAKQKAEDAANKLSEAKLAQQFSFRQINGIGQLFICPPFLCGDTVGSCFNNDIGNKAIYDWASTSFNSSSTATFASIMNAIPGVTIREYQVDYTIDQIVNLMQKFAEGFNAATNASTSEGDSTQTIAEKAKTVLNELRTKFKTIWEQIENGSFWKTLSDAIAGFAPEPQKNGMGSVTDRNAILCLPYIFYYKLMGYETTNIYTVPYSGSLYYKTSGANGWSKSERFGITAMLSDKAEGNGAMGKLIGLGKNFLKHIQVHKSPKFDPSSIEDGGDSYEVSFSLFNSSLTAAVNNYIFIHNLIPNNLWIQYGVIMQSSCLYDIKIDGGIRRLCCTGDFEVNFKGGLRAVPAQFLDELSKYSNNFTVKSAGNLQNIVKIPDIYEVKMTFTSLLPNNFNNYIYGFSNPDIALGHTNNIYTDVLERAAEEVQKLL